MKRFEIRTRRLGSLFVLALGLALIGACEQSPPSVPAGGASTGGAGSSTATTTGTAKPKLTDQEIKERVTELIEQLNGEDMGKRIEAADALAAFGPAAKHAVPSLIDALKVEDPLLQRDAALALGSIGEPAMPALIESASDESPVIRQSIAFILGRVKSAAKDGVPILIQMLKDQDANVRQSAAVSLGVLGSAAKEAIPALEEISQDESIGTAAKRSIQQIKAASNQQPFN